MYVRVCVCGVLVCLSKVCEYSWNFKPIKWIFEPLKLWKLVYIISFTYCIVLKKWSGGLTNFRPGLYIVKLVISRVWDRSLQHIIRELGRVKFQYNFQRDCFSEEVLRLVYNYQAWMYLLLYIWSIISLLTIPKLYRTVLNISTNILSGIWSSEPHFSSSGSKKKYCYSRMRYNSKWTIFFLHISYDCYNHYK